MLLMWVVRTSGWETSVIYMKTVKVVNVQRVESGCAWRKLNVQRVLDESTKNHVKMRSEKAEKKLRSRK
ncbi:unnamed protein product [Camellia sinensis]